MAHLLIPFLNFFYFVLFFKISLNVKIVHKTFYILIFTNIRNLTLYKYSSKPWNLQNSLKSKILIFWPKMTKCQTNLVRRKIFHRFFGLFSTQNHSNRKKKILKIFHFFWKFWPKMTLFGPNLGPNLVKMTWKYFFRFFRALNMKNDGSYDKISLILIFGHFRSKKGFLG